MKTKTMHVLDNELYMGSFKLEDLANHYKTPLYVYDETHIINNIKTFKENFKSNFLDCQIVYASKAFLAPRLARIVDNEGLYIDSVSYGDLYILKKSGFPMSKVLLHGNNKTTLELLEAIDSGVGYIVIDNINELQLLIDLAENKQKKVNTLFRFNPGIETKTHAYIQTSAVGSKFGESIFDEELIGKIVKLYSSSTEVILKGFHAHIGSQISNEESFYCLVNTMLEFVRSFEKKYSLPIEVLNFGGGFGIKYLKTDKKLPLENTLKEMVRLVEEGVKEHNLNINTIMIEPGRSIVGNAGVSIYTVGGVKTTFSGKRFVFVDGGMTDNIRPALYDAKYSHNIANRMTSGEQIKCDIVGKCCESGDIIALDTIVNTPKRGDILVVYSTGAYGYSMSSNYNGILRPAVVFVKQDEIREVIRRETVEDLVATYNFKGE